ncbi:hypothetical protein R3P38DRAFT_3504045 [Favolaschia claudopus]|uniref:TEA domain-containing protein n=1 Tax=Favolaschia claudopus TaxID=2862362 RepID=A0AAW0C467_9AGAR
MDCKTPIFGPILGAIFLYYSLGTLPPMRTWKGLTPRRNRRAPREYTVSVSNIWDFEADPKEWGMEQGRSEQLLNLTHRTSFKVFRDGSRAVWTQNLECALLQALYEYHIRNNDRERARNQKKASYRNRYIANRILEITNEDRTLKQVASRIQQLRRTSKHDGVLRLVTGLPLSDTDHDLFSNISSPFHLKNEIPRDMKSQLPITVIFSNVASQDALPEIFLESPQPRIRMCSLESDPGRYQQLILVSPVALGLQSTFQLFRNNALCSFSTEQLKPDGIRHEHFRAYITSFPDDLWRELCDRRLRDHYDTEWSILHSISRREDDLIRGTTRDLQSIEIRYIFKFEGPTFKVDVDQPMSTTHSKPLSIPRRNKSATNGDLLLQGTQPFAPVPDETPPEVFSRTGFLYQPRYTSTGTYAMEDLRTLVDQAYTQAEAFLWESRVQLAFVHGAGQQSGYCNCDHAWSYATDLSCPSNDNATYSMSYVDWRSHSNSGQSVGELVASNEVHAPAYSTTGDLTPYYPLYSY